MQTTSWCWTTVRSSNRAATRSSWPGREVTSSCTRSSCWKKRYKKTTNRFPADGFHLHHIVGLHFLTAVQFVLPFLQLVKLSVGSKFCLLWPRIGYRGIVLIAGLQQNRF